MLSTLGKSIFHTLINLGVFISFCKKTLAAILLNRLKAKHLIEQIVKLGIDSLFVVSVTALFVGMAFSVQVLKELLRFGAPDMVGGVIALAVWRELGPLLTAVVLAGRVGSAIAAEISSMKVNEQVDALSVMGQNVISFLVAPRVLAMIIMTPLLVGLADIIGYFGGLIITLATSSININSYINSANTLLTTFDIFSGLIKAVIFSLIISLSATFYGLQAKFGVKDVGRLTRKSVVVSLIAIFIANYLLSYLFFTA